MLVMVISTVQMLHEILQLFYNRKLHFNKAQKDNSSYLQVVFFCILKYALIFIWWSVETPLLCVDSIIVFCYYMCFKKIKLQKNGFKLFDTRYSEREKNNMTPTYWDRSECLSLTFLSYLISRFFFELRCIYWFSWQLCCLLLLVLLKVRDEPL